MKRFLLVVLCLFFLGGCYTLSDPNWDRCDETNRDCWPPKAPVAPQVYKAPVPIPAPRVAPSPIIVYFDFDRSNIRASEQVKIDKAYKLLTEDPKSLAVLTGHTDPFGPAAYNMRLSERRAVAVRNALVAKGIAAERIKLFWKGETELAVPGLKTIAENEVNRRTVVVIEIK